MIDLRELIRLINEKKNIPTHLCLDLNCKINGEDPKPLVKAINYILNYLRPLTDQEIQIALDSQKENYILVFIAYTKAASVQPLPETLERSLESYLASLEKVFEPAKYIQLKLIFPK